MVFLHRKIAILALALASAGPVPLWLHHLTAHRGATCSVGHFQHAAAQACTSHSCTGEKLANHPHSEPTAPVTPQLTDAHDHDCALCYQLAQSPSSTLSAAISDNALLCVSCKAASDSDFIGQVDRSHRPRGPPAKA